MKFSIYSNRQVFVMGVFSKRKEFTPKGDQDLNWFPLQQFLDTPAVGQMNMFNFKDKYCKDFEYLG